MENTFYGYAPLTTLLTTRNKQSGMTLDDLTDILNENPAVDAFSFKDDGVRFWVGVRAGKGSQQAAVDDVEAIDGVEVTREKTEKVGDGISHRSRWVIEALAVHRKGKSVSEKGMTKTQCAVSGMNGCVRSIRRSCSQSGTVDELLSSATLEAHHSGLW